MTISSLNKSRGAIDKEFLESDIAKLNVTFWDKYRKEKTGEYYIYDEEALKLYIEQSGGKVIEMG